jgi:hypothetical protein
VKNETEHVPPTRAQAADAMSMLHAVSAASAFHGAIANREDHQVALTQL